MNLTEQQQQELREELLNHKRLGFSHHGHVIKLSDSELKYLLNALDENKTLKERNEKLEKGFIQINGIELWISNPEMKMHFIKIKNELLNTKTDKQ